MAEIPDITGGDIEIGRRIAFEAGQHSQDKAIALLVAQVEAQREALREARAIMRELYEGLDCWTYGMNTVYAEDLKNAEAWLAAHKENEADGK